MNSSCSAARSPITIGRLGMLSFNVTETDRDEEDGTLRLEFEMVTTDSSVVRRVKAAIMEALRDKAPSLAPIREG